MSKSKKNLAGGLAFTTLGGRQLMTRDELLAEVQRLKRERAEVPGIEGASPPSPEDLQAVHDALLLTGSPRSIASVAAWLQATGVRPRRGKAEFHAVEVGQALRELTKQGRAKTVQGAGYGVDLAAHAERLDELLLRPEAKDHWLRFGALLDGSRGPAERLPHWLNFRNEQERATLLRLCIMAGAGHEEFLQRIGSAHGTLDRASALVSALLEPWLPRAVERLDPALRDALLSQLLDHVPPADPRIRPVHQWLATRDPAKLAPSLRSRLAEARLLALDLPGMRAQFEGLTGPLIEMTAAAEQALAGDWPAAAAGFETAYKTLRKVTGLRRGAVSPPLLRIVLASLAAQADPKAWAAARKLAITESGSRSPSTYDAWGLWVHALGVRLGEDVLEPAAFGPRAQSDGLLLAAWLGVPAPGWTAKAVQELLDQLQAAERQWLAAWVAGAAEQLGIGPLRFALPAGRTAPATFIGGKRERWRDALAAISALAEGTPAAKTAAGGVVTTLAWQLKLDAQLRVAALEPLERVVGVRGGVKFKPVTLAKLKKSAAHAPQDNAPLRHIERSPYGGARWLLDTGPATAALIGHPAVMFADAPGQWVELVEGLPELEVVRRKSPQGAEEQFEFHIHPSLLGGEPLSEDHEWGSQSDAERERRNSLRILREGPQRARLIRISATQRRVAELVAQGWAVPAGATAELGAALQVLSAHFQLHSDAAAGGQEVEGDSRLHARLIPLGEGLQLQLVAQPFGSFGPAVTPGQGRARLLCMHEGASLVTERQLDQEAAHRQDVLEALPFLDPEQSPEAPWLLADAEEALRAVELLPALPGIAALDWPRGKPLRVTPLAGTALNLSVSSGRDWLALSGEARVDEQRVLGLQELMQLARASRSRFVRLGEGDYLALSEQLRQQLRELDALAVARKDQLQLPHAAASWLDDTLDGLAVQGDKPWRARMDALAAAAALRPAVPAGLRAELRSYQQEGFAWMSRLAAAGLGACLADDMGLGKTVQTLALLLARAEAGPALVLAPTSVCGNWLAETEAFAPGLRCRIYGEQGDRAALLADLRPGDVLVVSYALTQLDADAFAAVEWATLVMDEAQALKNAATKRAKSVAEFQAGFRLALTGTPVENRLADLWSIMNLINPGLLGTAPQFGERFATPIEKQQDASARQRLRRLVSPFLLRRTKAQVLQDLPPRTEIVHLVQPSDAEKHFLEALRRNAQEAVAQAAAAGAAAPMQVLAELMRLRRAACDPRLVAPELGLVGAKLAEFERIVQELVAGGHKALVFSQFTDYLKLLAERLTAIGVSYQYLDGSTPAAERTKRVAAFQRGEGEVFLISLKAGGFGLNLTMADYVLIVDPWWNPAAEDQATGRAHRMGQQRPVTVYRLVTAGSVEERIIDLHRDKRGLADGILEGQDEATVLDAKALAALLRE